MITDMAGSPFNVRKNEDEQCFAELHLGSSAHRRGEYEIEDIPMRRAILLVLLPMAALSPFKSSASPAAAASPVSPYGQNESWTYIKPGLELSNYSAVLIRPTIVSTGDAAQFDGISTTDRRQFANLITSALQVELSKAFQVVQQRGARTIAIQVTILGAKKTIGGVATATRIMPIGLATSALKSLTGKKGTLTGSLLVEVEFANARTGELLAAAIRRRTPDPLDVPATLSTTDTVKAIARDMAKTIRQKLIDARLPARANQ